MFHRNYSFKWDLTKVKESSLKNIRIEIVGVYANGVGYLINPSTFERQIYPKLEELGKIKPAKMNGECPNLYICGSLGSSKGIYLHPMEFTGYMTLLDAKKICNYLNECDCVRQVYLDINEKPVYNLSNSKYQKLLINHTKDILQFLIEAKQNGVRYNYGFEFAEYFRLDTPFMDVGRSSMDVDVSFVENLEKVLTQLNITPYQALKLLEVNEKIKLSNLDIDDFIENNLDDIER